MRTPESCPSTLLRRAAHVAISALGLLAIVGSGGGDPSACMGYPAPPGCYGEGGPVPPSVSVDPRRIAVQVGTPVTFTANVYGYALPRAYTLQWCRQPRGAATCTAIAGATGETYTLAGANLADDGAQFQATVNDANGTAAASATLAVSSSPGVVFADGDFALSAWSVSAVVTPARGGATHSESRPATGGNPDAFRSVTYAIPAAPGSVRLFHASNAASYDPTIQGAVNVIDFSLDCIKLSFTGVLAEALPMIEQAGRRYIPIPATYAVSSYCVDPQWQTLPTFSVSASEFALADGPACSVREACPDFSAQAAPIRLGFATSASLDPSSSTELIVQGIDSWSATVWRR
jgi:hypothetical protein